MGDRRAVVIGAGITGILSARELLLSGWDVVVLDAAHVGAGSSSRTAAGIRQQFSTPGTVRGMRYCVDFYTRFSEETESGESPIVQNGYLFLQADDAAMEAARARVAMQQSVGLKEVEALDADALRARFPWVSDELAGATWCPTDGFLRPHVVYSDGAARVRSLGGELRQRSPVTGARVEGGRITTVTTPLGEVGGDLFIDCTNAWTARVGALLGASPLEVAPLKRYLWFVARGDAMSGPTLSSMPLTIAPSGAYCRPENGDTMLMGKKHKTEADSDFTYDDQDFVQPDFSHRAGIDAAPFSLWMELAEAIPDLADFAGVNATTAGYYATTPDHNPFLGFDARRPNLIRAVGFSGHGAMLGPFTARVVQALADAGTNLDEVLIDGEPVELGTFALGRTYDHSEAMVI